MARDTPEYMKFTWNAVPASTRLRELARSKPPRVHEAPKAAPAQEDKDEDDGPKLVYVDP